jgi:hypothetical protein
MKGRLHRPDRVPASQLPIIGNIKCGIKGDKFPQSVDYFIPTGKYASLFTDAYGQKPSTIQIVFINNDRSMVCNERYEYRDKQGRLFASGDGQEFEIWDGKKYCKRNIATSPDIMDQVEKICPGSHKKWEVILTLRFLIPKIKGIAGIWQFSTKGDKSSIPNIVSTFDTMMDIKKSIVGVMCDLTVQFAKSQKPGETSRFPVVSLVPNVSEKNLEILQGTFINPDQKQISG